MAFLFAFYKTIIIVINMGRKKIQIDKQQLYQLYITEQRSSKDIAKTLNVSGRLIKNRLHEFRIPVRDRIKAVTAGVKKKLKKIIDKDLLYDLYVNQNKSSRQIESIMNISYRTILTNLKNYDIPVKEPSKAMLGKHHSKEHKEKVAEKLRGEKSPHWRGGKTKIANSIKKLTQYSEWRLKCLERDQYTCQNCGKQPGRLHVDHIKPFALILEQNNIKTTEQAVNCKELWIIKNGKTLCVSCHRNTITWGYNTIKLLNKNTNIK